MAECQLPCASSPPPYPPIHRIHRPTLSTYPRLQLRPAAPSRLQIELMAVMQKARLPIRHDEIEELMRRYDPDDSGGFDFKEFADLLESTPGLETPRRSSRSPSGRRNSLCKG